MADIIIPSGKYKHFKGKSYIVFCCVQDMCQNEYVLYCKNYDDRSFWIRPKNIFLDTVEADGSTVQRFTLIGKAAKLADKINSLISILKREIIDITHSETEEHYCICEIGDDSKMPIVCPVSRHSTSGFLTEYELAERMGFRMCKIFDDIVILNDQRYPSDFQLHIGDNNKEIIEKHFNPCSIDLQIAENGFLRTRVKKLDICSIEHPTNATQLWKPIKILRNRSGSFFTIYPHQTILTHTKEKISIPNDCAGKIEIKSTYARLSLSVTMGDFCNPGYHGYFPLEITNHGKHIVILRTGETMAQLMLVPLSGPIFTHYTQRATFINDNGYDDGNPYTFYREKSIKLIRKQMGAEPIIDFYKEICNSITIDTVNDLNAYRDRFENNFLTFCQKKIRRKSYLNNDGKPNLKKLCDTYIGKENLLKRLYNLPIFTGTGSIIGSLVSFLISSEFLKTYKYPLLSSFILIFVISMIVFLKKPKVFCTLERIDTSRIIDKISNFP